MILLILAAWLLIALVVFIVFNEQVMPDGAWFQGIVNSLCWPFIALALWRSK